jgi:hypothetical protein
MRLSVMFFSCPYNNVLQTYNQNLIAELHGAAPDNISMCSISLRPQPTVRMTVIDVGPQWRGTFRDQARLYQCPSFLLSLPFRTVPPARHGLHRLICSEMVPAATQPDTSRQLGGNCGSTHSPKPLAIRLKPQTRYNRNAVVLPMASIRNTRLTSSKPDDIRGSFREHNSRDRDDGRLAYHRPRFVLDGDERSVALMANVTG